MLVFTLNLFALFFSLVDALTLEVFMLPILLVCMAFLFRLVWCMVGGRYTV